MSDIKSFTDLVGWKKAHTLVKGVYEVTRHFPPDEKFILVSQMRRSAISITSNIAEGFGRYGNKDKSRMYDYAVSSAYELQNQLYLAYDLNYIQHSKYVELANLSVEVTKIINALKKGVLASSI